MTWRILFLEQTLGAVLLLTKLTDQNPTKSESSRMTELLPYDHPPYCKRLELARRYRREE
jgi:hypothetical protein